MSIADFHGSNDVGTSCQEVTYQLEYIDVRLAA